MLGGIRLGGSLPCQKPERKGDSFKWGRLGLMPTRCHQGPVSKCFTYIYSFHPHPAGGVQRACAQSDTATTGILD